MIAIFERIGYERGIYESSSASVSSSEIRVLLQFFERVHNKLVCELLSALCSAAGKYLASVGGCHSLHEAVFLLTMELLGLVSSFHLEPSLILVQLRRGDNSPFT